MSLLVMVLVFPLLARAEESAKTIPFVYESNTVVDTTVWEAGHAAQFSGDMRLMAQDGKSRVVNKTTEVAPVEVSKIAELVTSVRKSICTGVKKGSFKVWLKFDANAKILGIGTSSEGGIEVNVTCG
jgi:hypothetical protein